jgi:hypothetical protein
MLPLSANSDFQNNGDLYKPTNYLDINGDDLYHTSVVYGTDALDQAIEAVIVTEPWERLFNIDFWSPFYRLLFNQEQEAEPIVQDTFDMIEKWVGVSIIRNEADISVNGSEHSVSLTIPYYYTDNGKTYKHIFSRVISK